MIRFIHIGDQIKDDADEFAFFDTVTSTFLSFDGEQVFDSFGDFAYFAADERYQRCLRILPERYSLAIKEKI